MNAAALHFRAATAADLDGLLALVQSAYRGESSRAGWTTEADLLDGQRTDVADLQACLARADSMLLVAERPGDVDTDPAGIVACAYIAPDDDSPSEAAQFGMFAVRPQLQGSGVGKAVMDEAERLVRDEWQLPLMRMSVIDVREELIGFYQRRGYRRTGIHKPFPYGDERFGLPRRADLRFEILEKRLRTAPNTGVPGDE
ncbi:GNAT family N-acetyltransferase [Lysobacter sp. H21R4]|uniref:GNAT family N-acetyltransferase n=1 Tax=Lysobacter sp. H21R4 TaxID=2781021 RepID=UPI0018899900|nr:N-acetyltransferase [Lysobacter sp. H21R4]QOY63472.1 GNAT family N-acetyltransferase [Lysobacter sp. H21R4]